MLKYNEMSSINATNVANEVLETVRKQKKVKLGEIIKRNGYALTTSTVPSQVTNTKSYKAVLAPVVKRWVSIRDNLTKELEEKDLTEESMRDIVDTIDKLTKNIQLLTGGNTENVGVIPIMDIFKQDVSSSNGNEKDSTTPQED